MELDSPHEKSESLRRNFCEICLGSLICQWHGCHGHGVMHPAVAPQTTPCYVAMRQHSRFEREHISSLEILISATTSGERHHCNSHARVPR